MYSFTTFLQGPDLEYFKMHALNYTADLVANGFEQAEFRSHADWLTREPAPFAEVDHENPNKKTRSTLSADSPPNCSTVPAAVVALYRVQ